MSPQKRPSMSLEEKKLLKLQQNQIAARQIRNTLIILALLAGCWFLYLVYINRHQPIRPDYQHFQTIEQIHSNEKTNSVSKEASETTL